MKRQAISTLSGIMTSPDRLRSSHHHSQRGPRLFRSWLATSVLLLAVCSAATAAAPPANDNFANAKVVSGLSGTVRGSNVGATFESGEPCDDPYTTSDGGVSVWYQWTAPVTGSAGFSTEGSNLYTLMSVYTGTSVSTLTTVGKNLGYLDDYSFGSEVTFGVVAGTTYYISVDGFNGDTGTITLTYQAYEDHDPVITSPATETAQIGKMFTYQIVATNNPTSYSVTNLPDGLTFDSTRGFISGMPTAPLYYVMTLGATNSSGTGQGTLRMQVYAEGVHPEFFDGEAQLDSGVYFLQFPDGNPFGYYSYLSDSNYIYHFDLGYEYVFDANDGLGGIYLYDFSSGTFFYTSPTFGFPYLYDFSLGSVLYYYPDASQQDHYTTNPRYFYDYATSQIITK